MAHQFIDTKMNLELLKKLVKLANNNPNDNEANSAARRVCKMIEDGKFNFVGDKQEPQPGNPFDLNDIFRQYRDMQNMYWDRPDYSKQYSEPPPPVTKKRECSECGNVEETSSLDQMFLCYACELQRRANSSKWTPKW